MQICPDYVLNRLLSCFLALGWHLEEVHVTWAHLENKQTRIRLYTKSFEESVHTDRGDGIAITKRRRRDFHSDGITDFATASERSRLKEDLESSTWRLIEGLRLRLGHAPQALDPSASWLSIELSFT
ncbi:hypothetical protein Tco_0223040 [Tanacetum coccineum]